MWKRTVLSFVMFLVLFCIGLLGCNAEGVDKEKIKDLEFTVVGDIDVPQELKELIDDKMEQPFKLTYADEQDMYIVIGAGRQECGGYSIAVRELYLTENSIVYKTELMGPETGEHAGKEPSYPVLIVKTEFREEPVVFK